MRTDTVRGTAPIPERPPVVTLVIVVSVINPFSSFQKVYEVKVFQFPQNLGGESTFLDIVEDRRCDAIICKIIRLTANHATEASSRP